MTSIVDIYEQAILSSAAYADLETGMAPDVYKAALEASGRISSVQADLFISNYSVVDQYTDPDSGFSGTVFRDTSGKIFIALRGTEPSAVFTDWPTNIADIGSDGIAIDQGIAMYNWYQRLIAPVGGTATQYTYHKEITDSTGQSIVAPAWLEATSVVVSATGEK